MGKMTFVAAILNGRLIKQSVPTTAPIKKTLQRVERVYSILYPCYFLHCLFYYLPPFEISKIFKPNGMNRSLYVGAFLNPLSANLALPIFPVSLKFAFIF
jgi:hypothetical protein